MKEHGDKISEEEKKAIEDGMSALKDVLKGTDTEEVKKKTQDLVQVSMKLGEAVYKSQQKDTPEKNEEQKTKKEDKENVVDADLEDVKDEKDAKEDKEDKEKSA